MIGFVSDIHGNYPALLAVVAELQSKGCQRIISLGDVTGYYAQPAECLDLLQELKAVQLLGNHDQYLINGEDCPRSRTVSELMVHQRKVLKPRHIRQLTQLQARYDEQDMSCVHGGWKHPLEEYLYQIKAESLPGTYRFYFSGHTHVQCLGHMAHKTYCNPGSVGQPRDGDPRAAFALLDQKTLSLHRVAYPIEETIEAMQRAGFTEERLWQNLYKGTQIGGRLDHVQFSSEFIKGSHTPCINNGKKT